jgi:hypothetical protein
MSSVSGSLRAAFAAGTSSPGAGSGATESGCGAEAAGADAVGAVTVGATRGDDSAVLGAAVTSARAVLRSRCSRGEVAPVMSVSERLTTPAAVESSAGAKRAA